MNELETISKWSKAKKLASDSECRASILYGRINLDDQSGNQIESFDTIDDLIEYLHKNELRDPWTILTDSKEFDAIAEKFTSTLNANVKGNITVSWSVDMGLNNKLSLSIYDYEVVDKLEEEKELVQKKLAVIKDAFDSLLVHLNIQKHSKYLWSNFLEHR